MEEHSSHDVHGQESDGKYAEVNWEISPMHPEAKSEVEVSTIIKDEYGKPIDSFATVHEKTMHMLAISKDLSVFQHLHPNYNGDGLFKVKTTFPKGGVYQLYADFLPNEAVQQLATYKVHVEGGELDENVLLDKELSKSVDGLVFNLEFPDLKIEEQISMIFTIKDMEGKPVTTLEPYLGSAGHVVIVSEDLQQFLHAHPKDEATTGPDVEYMTSFPVPGKYRIWGQFKYQSRVYTVPFTIQVPKTS